MYTFYTILRHATAAIYEFLYQISAFIQLYFTATLHYLHAIAALARDRFDYHTASADFVECTFYFRTFYSYRLWMEIGYQCVNPALIPQQCAEIRIVNKLDDRIIEQ